MICADRQHVRLNRPYLAHQSERYLTTTAPCRSSCDFSYQTWERHRLGWTVSALDDDDSLETLFEAILGFFNSKLVKDLERDSSESLLKRFWGALELGRVHGPPRATLC
jgi:hypothetical protein